MGIIDAILGTTPPEIAAPPVINTVLPNSAEQIIKGGKLPNLNINILSLKSGEVCHYVEACCLMTTKIERHYRRRNNGMSFKVTSGVYYHTGDSNSRPVEYKLPVYTKGYLYITNQRVVFSSKEKGFDKKLDAITLINPFTDAISIQFGSKVFNLLLPSSQSAFAVLKMLGK